MYEQFYGLRERPFDLTPNPRFLFMTSAHRDALAAMQYAISGRKGLTMVLGPPGTGKTTLVHAAMAKQERNVRAVYLGNPTLTREEFFEFLAQELGLSAHAQSSKAQFLRELRADLVSKHAQGTLTALVIDEAQAMSDGLLEELRLLENLETPSEKLLPVVLVGQPELAARLRQPALLPLRQRVALRFNLTPLSDSEVVGCISERIRIAGGNVWSVFSPEAVEAICQTCGGIPRNISVVCDNALVNGFALDERPISAAVIAEVCRDFELPLPRAAKLAASVATERRPPLPPPGGSRLARSPNRAPIRLRSLFRMRLRRLAVVPMYR
jgi:general secretion pathway protein A